MDAILQSFTQLMLEAVNLQAYEADQRVARAMIELGAARQAQAKAIAAQRHAEKHLTLPRSS